MAERYPGDGAAKNGFGRHWLNEWEARHLYEAGYPAPPDFCVPPAWALSAGGVLVPPVPEGDAIAEEIKRVRAGMPEEERADPANWPDNHQGWLTFFRERHARDMAAYEGPLPAPKRKNSAGRNLWWDIEGRMLATVLAHIENGNSPPLRYLPRPPPSASRRRGSSWIPRRMARASSSSSASESRSSGLAPAYSPPTHDSPLRQVKREASSPPRSMPRTRARGISISERRAPSPPRGSILLAKPKKEPGSGGLRKPKVEPGLRTPKMEPGLRTPKPEPGIDNAL